MDATAAAAGGAGAQVNLAAVSGVRVAVAVTAGRIDKLHINVDPSVITTHH
jgi:hypothetical protein